MSKETAFRKACRLRGDPCWICGEPIAYGKPRSDPWHWTKDHYMPVSTHPDLIQIVENWRSAHAMCNSRRGNRQPDETLWVGTKEDGYWLLPQRPWRRVSPSPKQRKKEQERLRREADRNRAEKERKKALCRCGEYQCTAHNGNVLPKRKRQTTEERDAGSIHLYPGPVVHSRRTVL